MVPETQHTLFVENLKNLYDAKNQLARMLPNMAKVVSAPPLREALTNLLHQTQVHLHRLEKIFMCLGVGPKGNNCAEMETMIAATRRQMSASLRPMAMDDALIAAVQRFEQFEVDMYASLRTSAGQLGQDRAAASLQESLDENVETNKKLAELAAHAATAAIPAMNGNP
jgi:ferritin-like metal-binding protein YciE